MLISDPKAESDFLELGEDARSLAAKLRTVPELCGLSAYGSVNGWSGPSLERSVKRAAELLDRLARFIPSETEGSDDGS